MPSKLTIPGEVEPKDGFKLQVQDIRFTSDGGKLIVQLINYNPSNTNNIENQLYVVDAYRALALAK